MTVIAASDVPTTIVFRSSSMSIRSRWAYAPCHANELTARATNTRLGANASEGAPAF
jgi:hypothetical protein